MAVTIETVDTQLTQGRKSLLRRIRPMVEGTSVTPTFTPKYRNRLQESHTTGTAVAANANGVCPTRVNARYHRAKITIPAGDAWELATGLDDIVFTAMGTR